MSRFPPFVGRYPWMPYWAIFPLDKSSRNRLLQVVGEFHACRLGMSGGLTKGFLEKTPTRLRVRFCQAFLPSRRVMLAACSKDLLMVVSKWWFESCAESKFPYPLLP